MKKFLGEFSALEGIEAIALGGSRAGDQFDAASDYDIYIYCRAPIEKKVRQEILAKYCQVMELGNHFWEYEDNAVLKSGTSLDLVYRNLDAFLLEVSSVAERFCAKNGYTTCMWHNLVTCKIVYDEDGRLENAKKRFNIPYPRQLQKNIVTRNLKLLDGFLPSYKAQILKAANRGDVISVNHRITAFLESYFDLIFARNQMTHPGEKRLLSLCQAQCAVLPENFEKNLRQLFCDLFSFGRENGESLRSRCEASARLEQDLSQLVEEVKKICVLEV